MHDDRAAVEGWRREILVQSNNNHLDVSPASWARTLRTDRYRYTHYLCDGGEQLFDLAADPDERDNLASDPRYQCDRDRLRGRLLEAAIRDSFPNGPRDLYRLCAW